MCEISVIIPVRDEEENIPELVKRLFSTFNKMNVQFEIIFVTDINSDNTVSLLAEYSGKHQNMKVLKLSNSFGQHVAVMAGLDHCSGNYIVTMDGDLQDYPEDISLLYYKITEGYDVVYTLKESKNDTLFRNFSSWVFNSIMNNLSDFKMQSNSSMFRIISRRALIEITKFREHEPSLTYIFSYINLPTATIRVKSGMRQQGKTKYGFFRLVGFAISSLLSFSRKPLRFIAILGLIMSAFSFLYFAIVLYQYFSSEIEILGWATIIAITTFMGGIQLLSIGVIGEYIGRMYIQTKNRPLYIIEKTYGDFGHK